MTPAFSTADQINDALDSMDTTTRAMAIFGIRQAINDAAIAAAAGHGLLTQTPPSSTYPVEDFRRRWPHLWTALDEAANVRLSYDYNLLNEYHPDAIGADCERKITLLLAGDPQVVSTLIQQWVDRTGFDPDWAAPTPTGRQYADRRQALEAVLLDRRTD